MLVALRADSCRQPTPLLLYSLRTHTASRSSHSGASCTPGPAHSSQIGLLADTRVRTTRSRRGHLPGSFPGLGGQARCFPQGSCSTAALPVTAPRSHSRPAAGPVPLSRWQQARGRSPRPERLPPQQRPVPVEAAPRRYGGQVAPP